MFISKAFQDGGVFMYFILVFAVLTLGFIVERFRALYFKAKDVSADFRTRLAELCQRGDWVGAERFCRERGAEEPVARIALEAVSIRARSGGEEEIQARMDERLSAEVSLIDQRTGFLAMFGNVATLVGLLGTIGGMVVAFAGVADANPADRATMLSKGISHALNCTAFGLLVAIPALVFFAVLQNRTDQLVKGIISTTTQIYHDLIFSNEMPEKSASTRASTNRDRSSQPSPEVRA
jgi:biopolymer transport protein ExbB